MVAMHVRFGGQVSRAEPLQIEAELPRLEHHLAYLDTARPKRTQPGYPQRLLWPQREVAQEFQDSQPSSASQIGCRVRTHLIAKRGAN
jgi:hypothetical protein